MLYYSPHYLRAHYNCGQARFILVWRWWLTFWPLSGQRRWRAFWPPLFYSLPASLLLPFWSHEMHTSAYSGAATAAVCWLYYGFAVKSVLGNESSFPYEKVHFFIRYVFLFDLSLVNQDRIKSIVANLTVFIWAKAWANAVWVRVNVCLCMNCKFRFCFMTRARLDWKRILSTLLFIMCALHTEGRSRQ